MLFRLLLFAVLVALWWGVLWFALPVGWLQGTMPSFIAIHTAPPLLAVAAWWGGKRAWVWRLRRAKKRAEDAEVAKEMAAKEADRIAHQKVQEQRRVHVDCRAVWAVVIEVPAWFGDEPGQRALMEQPLQKTNTQIDSLQQVFEQVFLKCEACVWLPVKLVDDDPAHRSWVKQAWHQATTEGCIEHFPPQPDCAVLPGEGAIPDRLIALFEQEPDLPAVILVGMDSPLTDTPEDSDPQAEPGHAVVAVLLSRPELVAPAKAEFAPSGDDAGSMTPYWERENRHEADPPQWQRIPAPLRQGLWDHAPFATLHRSNTVGELESERDSVLARQISDAILEVCINAGFRDLPFKEEKAEEAEEAQEGGDAKAQAKPKPKPKPKPKEPEPLDLGWFVHNSGSSARLGALSSALRDHGCEISAFKKASDLDVEHGNVGKAREVLMLAEALVRVEQLQKPVLTADFNEDDSLGIGLVRPFSGGATTEEKSMPTEAERT